MEKRSLSIECDNCGAKVPATATHGKLTCEYCGHSFRIEPRQPARPPVRRASPPAQARAGKLVGVIMAISLLLTIGGGLVAWLVTSSVVSNVTSAVGSGPMKVTTAGGKTLTIPGGKRVSWDNVGGPPLTVQLGGVEHVLGRIRDLENNGQLSVRVFESSTLKPRFRTPDMGAYSEAYRAVHYTAVGERLLVSDKRNVLHVYDLSSGKELKTHELTDRVEQLCPLLEGSKVWVQVLDKRHLLFDVQSFAAEEARDRPAHCPRSVFMARHAPPRMRGEARRQAPKVDGFEPKRLFVDGDLAVVYGAKSPGTPIPTAAGFDPKSREVRWKKPSVQADPTSYRSSFERFRGGLAGGRFVAVYGTGSKTWHVGALDARTGDALWDVQLRKVFAVDHITGLRVTAGFVYVVRTSSLDVLKAKDGALVGSIGHETYTD